MDNIVKEALDKIQQIEADLKFYRDKLSDLRKKCNHLWGEAVYDRSIYADTVSTLFSHAHSLYDNDRWTRTCSLCGLTESTNRVKITRTPNFEPEEQEKK